MVIFLTTLLGTLSSEFRSRAVLALENLALRHQIGVLQRSARKRCELTPADRVLWVLLSRLWSDWRSALVIVTPETVVAWHRAGLRRFWTWKVRRGQPGRPLSAELIRAVVEMRRRNPNWGCSRIALQIALAFHIQIDKDMVRRILAHHRSPGQNSGGPSWLTFLGHLRFSP